ncbi:MAG: hypothetical protein FXF54_00535, partial [Kosmotoga sp.]
MKKFKLAILLLLITGLFVSPMLANEYGSSNTPREKLTGKVAIHDVGWVENSEWADNGLGNQGNTIPGFTDPYNNQETGGGGYLYEGNFWFGAKVGPDEYAVSTGGYGSEFNYEGEIYISSGKGADWPLPFQPISQQDTYFHAYDYGSANTGQKLGIDMEVKGLQWSYAPYNDFIIYEVTITNNSGGPLEEAYFGMRYDPDTGADYTNDLNRFSNAVDIDQNKPYYDPSLNYVNKDIVTENLHNEYNSVTLNDEKFDISLKNPNGESVIPRNMSYQWSNEGNVPLQGGQGIFAHRVLGVSVNGERIPAFYETEQGNYKPTPGGPVATCHQWWTIDTDPSNDNVRYKIMAEGGLTATKYLKAISQPNDMRFYQSVGPYTLEDGDVLKVTLAVTNGYAAGASPGGSYSDLEAVNKGIWGVDDKANPTEWYSFSQGQETELGDTALWDACENLDYAQQAYELDYGLVKPTAAPELDYTVVDKNSVIVRWSDDVEDQMDTYLGKNDFEGYKIYTSKDKSSWKLQKTVDKESYTRQPIYKTYVDDDTGDTYVDENTIIGYEDTIIPYGNNTGLSYHYKATD